MQPKVNKLILELQENSEKLKALHIRFTADTIHKTPEWVFIRAFLQVNGKYCTSKYSTGIKCLRVDWQADSQTITGNEIDTQSLRLIKKGIEKKYLDLAAKNLQTTANDLYLCLVDRADFGSKQTKHSKPKNQPTLIYVCEVLQAYHDYKLPQQAEYQKKSYTTSLNFWDNYLKNNKLEKLKIENIANDFLNTVYEQLKSQYTHNTLLKYLGFFRAAFNHCINKKLCSFVHFENLNKGGIEATRTDEYLSLSDYEKLKNFVFVGNQDLKITKLQAKKLDIARDVYVFMCETGFCYADYFRFDYALHVKQHKDMFVFCKKRHKLRRVKNDKTVSQRGLLSEVAIQVLTKYNNKLPKLAYDNLKNHLKKIANLVNLPSFLSRTHSGRHSAGMLLLNEGLAIQDVQAFMGHKNLSTTQSTYAIAETEKVAEAMRRIQKKPL